jgi:hypothetical protein
MLGYEIVTQHHGSTITVEDKVGEFSEVVWRSQMPIAYFVVRATVSDPAKRKAFDAWYSREHLPDAIKSFGVSRAWRFWSTIDPSQHQAMYQFDDEASLDRAVNGAEMKRLIADFNRDWPDVTRTREALVLAEEFAA